jgi:hypothetical protein
MSYVLVLVFPFNVQPAYDFKFATFCTFTVIMSHHSQGNLFIYLFISGLFNDTDKSLHHTAPNAKIFNG